MTYECHITTTVADEPEAAAVASALGWKTSEIKRDPLLGDASHFYLTAHDTSFPRLYVKMKRTAAELKQLNCTVLREKIELIVYDTKTGTGV